MDEQEAAEDDESWPLALKIALAFAPMAFLAALREVDDAQARKPKPPPKIPRGPDGVPLYLRQELDRVRWEDEQRARERAEREKERLAKESHSREVSKK